MKEKSSKKAVILIVIMSLICLAAVGISVRVSITMLEKRTKIITNKPSGEVKANAQNSAKLVNINKLKELNLYINGDKLEGEEAFQYDKGEFLLPLDVILNKIGVKFNYFNSDDILKANIKGNDILIKLWKNSFVYGGREIILKSPPAAAKDHILVPDELFKYVDGFKVESNAVKNSIFMNYYPGYNNKSDPQLRMLRIAGKKAQLSDITGEKVYWSDKAEISEDEGFYFPAVGSGCILKSGGKTYSIRSENGFKPVSLNVNKTAIFSVDGKYLQWMDDNKKNLYMYNIKNGTVKKKSPSADDNIQYSPDMKKIIYYRSDKGYYVSNSDGTGAVLLGEGFEARWITGSRIFFRAGRDMFLVGADGKNKVKTDVENKTVGRDAKGNIFYTRGSILCLESGGKEKEIAELPWKCEYVYGLSDNGQFLAVSDDEEDGVFYLTGKMTVKTGKRSQLLRSIKEGDVYPDLRRSIVSSPDGRSAAVFQREDGLITLNVFNGGWSKPKKVVLNYQASDKPGIDFINSKWLSNTRILVYTDRSGWVVDLKDDVKIFEWQENEGSTIKGVLP